MPLSPADLTGIDLTSVVDVEVPVLRQLPRLPEIVNSVVTDDTPDKGFVASPLWRGIDVTRPHNARPLELHVAMAFFVTVERPWNPYLENTTLRHRLELVLDRYCQMQLPCGAFPEYEPNQPALAPTSFGARYMVETLALLRDSERRIGRPAIDPQLFDRSRHAARRAIETVLADAKMFDHASRYANQFGGVVAAALGYVALFPDDPHATQMRQSLLHQYRRTLEHHRSPAGYPYERDGCDFGYTLNTEQFNKLHARHYLDDERDDISKAMLELMTADETDWVEWLSYNSVPERGIRTLLDNVPVRYWVLNQAIETRQTKDGFARETNAMVDRVPLAAAFAETEDELQDAIIALRQQVRGAWPEPSQKRFLPDVYIRRKLAPRFVEPAQRKSAIELLPYVSRERFAHVRADNRHDLNYTFVRRPGYYTVFNAGTSVVARQRFGLGLLWHPNFGVALHNRPATVGAGRLSFGTRANNMTDVYERTLNPTFTVGDSLVELKPGRHDLPDGLLTINYALCDSEDTPIGQKRVEFFDDHIDVTVTHPGLIEETLPRRRLDTDTLHTSPGELRLVRDDMAFVVRYSPATVRQDVHLIDPEVRVADAESLAIILRGHEALNYQLRFDPVSSKAIETSE